MDKKLEAVGVCLILTNVDPEIYEIFEITHLDRFFDVRLKGEDDFQAKFGGVGSRLEFPKPSGGPTSCLPPWFMRVFQGLWSLICRAARF